MKFPEIRWTHASLVYLSSVARIKLGDTEAEKKSCPNIQTLAI